MTTVDPAMELKLRVLIHESEQIHETIGRALNTANTLYGLVLPGAFAVLVFSANETADHFPVSLLTFGFAGIVAATLIYNAGIWVEVSRYLRYKYRAIYPDLYELGSVVGRENFGVFLASEHRRSGAGATIAFHVIAQLVTLALVIVGAIHDDNKTLGITLAVLAALLLLGAGLITLSSAREVARNMALVAGGGREGSPGSSAP